jgi:hypothetical protein
VAVPGLVLFGPDPADCVKCDPQGLHIILPSDFPRQRPGTGVVTDFGVKGDFEITVSYTVLQGAQPGVTGNPTELRLVVVPNESPRPGMWQRADQNRTVLSRQAPGRNQGVVFLTPPGVGGIPQRQVLDRTQAGAFLADCTRWNNEDIPKDPWGNEIFNNIELHTYRQAPAAAPTGRLRLVRGGATLGFYTIDGPGDEFTFLHSYDFGTGDLKNVRVLGSTGGPGVLFDVRVTDISIRAEGLPKAPSAAVAAAPPRAPESARSGWLGAVLALLALSVAAVVSLGAWYYARARRRPAPAREVAAPAAARAIVFKCCGCGKRLRARPDQAGTSPKCPQCGTAVVVPGAFTEKPEGRP